MPITKMPADKLEQFRNRLLDMRDRMLGEVDGVVESIQEEINPTGDLSNAPVHLADSAPEQIDADINVIENERGMMEEVQAALKRIDDGTYGTCINCGVPIPEERLEAIPYTPYCVRCASEQAETIEKGATP
jgi:RNA polymerase-binding protein DksA